MTRQIFCVFCSCATRLVVLSVGIPPCSHGSSSESGRTLKYKCDPLFFPAASGKAHLFAGQARVFSVCLTVADVVC